MTAENEWKGSYMNKKTAHNMVTNSIKETLVPDAPGEERAGQLESDSVIVKPYLEEAPRSKIRRIREIFFRVLLIFVGASIYTAGLDLFLVPNNTIDGGVTGLSLMAATLTGLPFGMFFIVINLPFLYLGYKQIGKSFTLATLLAVVIVSILSEYIKGLPPITTDPFLSAVFGGIILGIGVGLIIRSNGSLDGTEIVAIILDKKTTFSVGEIIMFFNLFILGAAGFVYNWNSAMYSLIVYFIAYKMMDVMITGLDESKGVMIVSSEPERIAEALMFRLGRGVTILHGEGGYLHDEKRILYSVITRLEITKIKDIVYEIEPNAFITITDVYDVMGGQFSKKSIH